MTDEDIKSALADAKKAVFDEYGGPLPLSITQLAGAILIARATLAGAILIERATEAATASHASRVDALISLTAGTVLADLTPMVPSISTPVCEQAVITQIERAARLLGQQLRPPIGSPAANVDGKDPAP